MARPPIKKNKYPVGIKLLIAAGIITAVGIVSFAVATMIYWVPQFVRSSELMEHGIITSGEYVDKDTGFIPHMSGRNSSVHLAVVAYTVEGSEFTTTTPVRDGGHYRTHISSETMYYDATDPSSAVSNQHLEYARMQIIIASIALAGALAIIIARLTIIIINKHKATKK